MWVWPLQLLLKRISVLISAHCLHYLNILLCASLQLWCDYTHLFPTLVHVHVVIEFPKHVHVQMYMYANVYRLVHVHVFDKTMYMYQGVIQKGRFFHNPYISDNIYFNMQQYLS